MKLQEIKDQVAIENGFFEWANPFGASISMFDAVCKRYANECVKASLERAADNVRLGPTFDTVDKDSITDRKNIILL